MSSVLYEPNAAEWAWAAGFYEGEGTFVLAGGVRSRCLALRIGQKDTEPLERFLSIVRVGKINGPYVNGVKGERTHYVYSLSRLADVRWVIQGISPWLSKRRIEQIEAVESRYAEYQAGLQKNQISSIMENNND